MRGWQVRSKGQSVWQAWPGTPDAGAAALGSVADGAAELDAGRGPVSGFAAWPLLPGGGDPGRGALAGQARRALALAASGPFPDGAARGRWLYDYGTAPLRPGTCRPAPLFTPADQAQFDGRYTRADTRAWTYWEGAAGDTPPRFKLYLSPAAGSLEAALALLAGAVAADPVAAFKLVAQRWQTVRPDKIILYFHDSAGRDAWSGRFAPGIAGLTAHGVPFTAPLDPDGLLSVAEDPVVGPGGPAQSWRSWLTARLGHALDVAARAGAGADDAAAFACARVRVEGVDPATWARPPRRGPVAPDTTRTAA